MPKLALRHVYLLYQVLLVSVYHLAHLNPDCLGFPVCALQHQNEAIKGLRSAIKSILQDNYMEIFLASLLLSIGTFAGFRSLYKRKLMRVNASPYSYYRPAITDYYPGQL
ncbi:hypothetical protein FCULG_00012873 [Fusarium culmorum]|uniref:Uncharacterized protein n=1 Tax=Fusarium culmorum TaxID=5516 RepID=A0A2T4GG76_FUSCU|nr:hypothetical protein FCULG_00012873 [Fusarium culmorum]